MIEQKNIPLGLYGVNSHWPRDVLEALLPEVGSGKFGDFDYLDRAIAGEIPDVGFDGLSLVVRRNDPTPVRADRD